MTKNTIETIGYDLGDKQSELCVLLPRGGTAAAGAAADDTKGVHKVLGSTRPRAHVVIEVGTHSRRVSELLRDLGS